MNAKVFKKCHNESLQKSQNQLRKFLNVELLEVLTKHLALNSWRCFHKMCWGNSRISIVLEFFELFECPLAQNTNENFIDSSSSNPPAGRAYAECCAGNGETLKLLACFSSGCLISLICGIVEKIILVNFRYTMK